jgi:hypothetical protein
VPTYLPAPDPVPKRITEVDFTRAGVGFILAATGAPQRALVFLPLLGRTAMFQAFNVQIRARLYTGLPIRLLNETAPAEAAAVPLVQSVTYSLMFMRVGATWAALGWKCADLGWKCADLGWICADLGWICADLGWICAEVGFIFAATGALAGALSDLVLVDLLEVPLFTSDFLMTAIGLFLECRI